MKSCQRVVSTQITARQEHETHFIGGGVRGVAGDVGEAAVCVNEADAVGVRRSQRVRGGEVGSDEGEELRVVDLARCFCGRKSVTIFVESEKVRTSIGTTSAREHDYLVAGCAAVIEVEARVREAADNERLPVLVVVQALSNKIEFLPVAAVAGLDGDRGQVLAEVTRSRVDREALAVGALDLDAGGSTGGSQVLLLGLGDSGAVEGSTSTGDLDGRRRGCSSCTGSLGGGGAGRSGCRDIGLSRSRVANSDGYAIHERGVGSVEQKQNANSG